jgi:hypothetical protein
MPYAARADLLKSVGSGGMSAFRLSRGMEEFSSVTTYFTFLVVFA